jgi:hypothetical protein
MEDFKVLHIPAKFIYFIYICLLSITIIFLIGFLASPSWVSQGEGRGKWKGSLTEVKDISNDFPEAFQDYEGDSYSSVADDICDSDEGSDIVDALCDMFTNLYAASIVVILFEVFNILVILVWIFIIFMVFRGRNYFIVSLIVPAAALAAHLIAFSAWMGIANATFEDDCDDFNDGSDPAKVCAESGPKFGLFILIWIILLYGLWFLFKLQSKLIMQKSFEANAQHNSQFQMGERV